MQFSKQILILDDNQDNRWLLRKILTVQKFNLIEVDTSIAAREIIKREHIDIVILSLSNADGCSLEFLNWVKEYDAKVSVVVVTHKKLIDAFHECSEIGGDDYITMPLDFTKVHRVIKRTMELSQKRVASKNSDDIGSNNSQFSGYQTTSILGKGNMGIVYLAEKSVNGEIKQFALKKLHPAGGLAEVQKREMLERFLREAEAASSLRHPNIVQIIDYGYSEHDLIPFIVMHLVEGKSLRYYINNLKLLSYLEKARVLRQVAHALTAIHAYNICHRDIKPENILLTDSLDAKVTDFGIAQLPNSELTHAVKILGTPAYMAPEAFVSAKVDYRADIYSLGAVAYELFLGRKPFISDSILGLRELVLNKRPVNPRKVDFDFPSMLIKVLAKMLKKNPDLRYRSAAEIVLDLDFYLQKVDEYGENIDKSGRGAIRDQLENETTMSLIREMQNETNWS